MNKPQKLQLIQGYRAFAVLLVMLSHALYELKKMMAPMGLTINDKQIPGDFGVDLFFVISGFIMVYATAGNNGSVESALDFMKRRIIRIIPLYWVATTLMIITVIVLPGAISTATALPENWLKSYLFIPFGREHDGLFRPVLGLGWSLNYEMFFYLIFAVCLVLPRAIGLFSVVAALCLISFLDQMNLLGSGILGFWGRPIVLEFGFGIMIGWAYMSGVRIPLALGLYGVVVGIVAAFVVPEYHVSLEFVRHLFYGLPATMLVAAAVLTRGWDEIRLPKIICELGDMSYSTYLVHPFFLGASALLWKFSGLNQTLTQSWGISLYILVSVIGGHILAYCVHVKFDAPLTTWMAKRAFSKGAMDKGVLSNSTMPSYSDRLARL